MRMLHHLTITFESWWMQMSKLGYQSVTVCIANQFFAKRQLQTSRFGLFASFLVNNGSKPQNSNLLKDKTSKMRENKVWLRAWHSMKRCLGSRGKGIILAK